MTKIKGRLLQAASVTALCAVGVSAQAQTAAPADQTQTVHEVVVTGVRASLRDALAQKRASDLVVETISSKDIGVLPDVTIAEELDRLPGINATRDRGNDSQASVRGGGPRLVLGLLNGREIASSEPDRNVRWEIFPSESVGGVTVYKTQSADLIAGGVMGTIDIQSLKPLDYHGPAVTLRAGPVYYDGVKLPGYDRLGWRGGVEIVHKFSDTLGVAIGASYQEQKNGYDSFQGWGYNTAATGGSPPILNGVATSTPWGAQTEADELTEQRAGFTTALQWKPSAEFEVSLDALYSDVRIDEDQYQQWYGRGGAGWGDWGGNNANAGDEYNPANGSSFTTVNGVLVAAKNLPWASVTNTIAHYTENKTLLATGANAIWRAGDWKTTADLSYSQASRKDDWQAIFTENYPATTSFDTSAGHAPVVTTSGDPADPSSQNLAGWLPGESNPEQLNDALAAARIDVSRDVHNGFVTQWDFGLRASDRVKGHSQQTYYESPLISSLPSNMLSQFNVSGFTTPSLLYGNFNELAKLAYGGFTLNNVNSTAVQSNLTSSWNQNYWRVREDDLEAYVKAVFAADIGSIPMKGNVGVRLVDVWTGSNGWESLNGGGYTTPVYQDHHTTDALPSLNMNFSLRPDLKLRLGVAKVMARPPLDEMRAERQLAVPPTVPLTGTAGNPGLNPFRANQIDTSLEWYFHPESLISVSAYYKDVSSNIGYKTQTETINGLQYTITGPFNGSGGKMDGLEFTFQTPFYFIPALQHFGIYSNLALANSNIKEYTPSNNPLPQVGFAHTTAEADLWYSFAGVDTRLAYKYHSPFTVIYGWDASQLTRLESESTLDFSASYSWAQHYTVRLQAANLTDQVSRYYWNNDPNQLARYDHYGRRILVDFTFKY